MFFLLYRHTNNSVIDDFLEISHHFPKILQNLSEGLVNVAENFPKISEDCRRLPKIAEDFRRRPEDISIIHQRIKHNLRDKLNISESIDSLTSEDMENTPLEARMWFRMNFTSGVFSNKTLVSI